MKLFFIAGILSTLASGIQPTIQQMDNSIQTYETHIQQLESQFVNEIEDLFGNGIGNGQTSAQIQNTLQQVNDTVAQMQQLISQQWIQKYHVRHLPSQSQRESTNAHQQIQVIAGDIGVSRADRAQSVAIINQLSLPIIKKHLNELPSQAQIVLFSTPDTYKKALKQAGVPSSEMNSVVQNTGGLTVGSHVWIPLYNISSEAELANVLTHELTHVTFNQAGIGNKLPTWINEGTAWMDGIAAQAKINPQSVAQMSSAYAAQMQKAVASGVSVPLTAGETKILSTSYNIEWEDYLAVQQLVNTYGAAKYQTFLNDIQKQSVADSFSAVYPMSLGTYEQSFYREFTKS